MKRHRMPRAGARLAALLPLLLAMPAQAFRFEFDNGIVGSLSNTASVGAHWRVQERDPRLIGKTNLDPSLCGQDQCLGFTEGPETAEQIAFRNAPGNYSINSDDGDLNYDKGDVVAAVAKLTSELSLSYESVGLFARGVYFFDQVNDDFTEHHPNRALGPTPDLRGPQRNARPDELTDEIGHRAILLDAYVYGDIPLDEERELTIRVGDQLVNWGESTFLVVNSINTVNPPNVNRYYAPSYEVREVFQPVPMAFATTRLSEYLSVEGFYEWGWKGIVTAPPGSYFATSDLGVPGGTYASLPYGSNAEDPGQVERIQGPEGLVQTLQLSESSLTVLRDPDREPRGGGQYGVALKYLAEELNSTEFGLFYLNYHSRLPYVSATAGMKSCLRPDDPAQSDELANCAAIATNLVGGLVADTGSPREERDMVPVDTVRIFIEYPEDVRLYGLSFNTTVGDWAVQGEYAYRPNLPVQVDLEDVASAALRPSFPREDVPIPEVAAQFVVPGQDTAVPDLVETRYRRNPDVKPRQYIRGYERLEVGQMSTSVTYVRGSDNYFFADQWIMLAEFGFTQVFDLPSKSRVLFEGPGTPTHGLPGRKELNSQQPINPEQNRGGYVDPFAWGYRLYTQLRYTDVLPGISLQPTATFSHDVSGVAPGPGENFVAGRKSLNATANILYGQLTGIVGGTLYFGGGRHHAMLDRDFVTLAVKYEF